MSLHYVVIGPAGGTYHVAYRVPNTNTFSSVALAGSHEAASRLANDLNTQEVCIVAIPEDAIPFAVSGSK